MLTIEALNSMDRKSFLAALGWVFEDSPWVAERAWDGLPFPDCEALHQKMCELVEAAGDDRKLALIRAHPDLGSRARMSEASTGEQSSAGLQSLSAEQFAELHRLNTAYRERFGFPFIYAVKGSNAQQILVALASRVHNSPEQERRVALEQIFRIARFRLETILPCTPL